MMRPFPEQLARCAPGILFTLRRPSIRMSLADGSAAAKGENNPKMKTPMRICMVVLAALLLAAGNMEARAQSAQQTADQAKADANATKPAEIKSADGAPTTKKNNPGKATSATTPTA